MTATDIVFHPHRVELIERPEGYREFRCLPATWSYASPRPLAALLTEYYSQRMATDPQGYSEEVQFWSGSDTALRLRDVAVDDLALRELTVLATRRETGINAPKPWVSLGEISPLAREWEREATDIHFSQVPVSEPGRESLWDSYGMGRSHAQPIIFGYGMRTSVRPTPGQSGTAWAGGPGTWYTWSTLGSWKQWPRRQDAEHRRATPDAGKLLLFVSHRWESLEHPDPTGAQLLALDVGLALSLAAAILRLAQGNPSERTVSGLPELMAEFLSVALDAREGADPALRQWAQQMETLARRTYREKSFRTKARRLESPLVRPLLTRLRDLVLVWYDYASMHQTPRSADEEAQFRREILTLNAIQAHGATVVIAGNERYVERAWCFLELSGGMRGRIVELTPSWGWGVGVGDVATRWASRSDQLIGALHTLGPSAMERSGLAATHREDLPAIARLLGDLPVMGMLETDDSDLIGGAIPTPFRDGHWMRVGRTTVPPPVERTLPPLPVAGRLPPAELMHRTAGYADVDALGGEVGVWVYSTQKALALAWADRAAAIWESLRSRLPPELPGDYATGALGHALASDGGVSVCCMWADARALAEDGRGWTRVIPSAVEVLLVVAPADVPELCRIYDRVVAGHLACGVPVVMYAPETGRTLIYQPDGRPGGVARGSGGPRVEAQRADVLVVPRLRRSDAYPRRMFVPPSVTQADVEVLAALRLDPGDGFVRRPGAVSPEVAAAGFGRAGDPILPEHLLAYSEARVRAEGIARSTTASWDTWCTPRLHQSAWEIGFAPSQLHIIDQLVRKAASVSDNPFERRKLIYILVEDEKGYGLPPSILEDADELIARIRQARAATPSASHG